MKRTCFTILSQMDHCGAIRLQHQEKADQQNSSVEFEDAKQKTKGKLIDSRTNLH